MFQINGYETIEKTGEGGMATVWKARHLTLDRLVAIKVLTHDFAGDNELLERFRLEAQAAAKIKHPNVVGVFDAGEANGLPYYVMEFAEGPTIHELILSHGPLDPEQSIAICLDIARALGDCWQNNKIIHCDIKPENVIIENASTVRILDLGLSRIIGMASHEEMDSDMTVGTPNFMPPESAMALELDPRSDMYSLGAMLYQMVTGVLPFGDLDPNDVLEGQVNGFIEDPWVLNPEIPVGLAWLIEKMMAKDAVNRHPDWDAVMADMVSVVETGSLAGKSSSKEFVSTVRRSEERPRPKSSRLNVKGGKKTFKIAASALGAGALASAGVGSGSANQSLDENPNNVTHSLIALGVFGAIAAVLYLIALA